jgi:hypothetical protein
VFAKNVADIQADYPTPCTTADDDGVSWQYCVGGALCLAHGFLTDSAGNRMHFPEETELAAVFERLNPALDGISAYHFAQQLIIANDTGDFERAWDIAETALTLQSLPRIEEL